MPTYDPAVRVDTARREVLIEALEHLRVAVSLPGGSVELRHLLGAIGASHVGDVFAAGTVWMDARTARRVGNELLAAADTVDGLQTYDVATIDALLAELDAAADGGGDT